MYDYPDVRDREVVGLISSSLAYGNVKQIVSSINDALSRIGDSPFTFIVESNPDERFSLFSSFVHRFAKCEHVIGLLSGIRGLIGEYSSIENAIKAHLNPGDTNILPSLTCFVESLRYYSSSDPGHLIPNPSKGSACKRLLLFYRWMVRKDDVDPGGWDVQPSLLLVPLDTHMHHLSMSLGFTNRKHADMRSVLEITRMFSKISPNDPVKYDFALTRLGIRPELCKDSFIKKCKC